MISVIIPVYNMAAKLPATLDSLFAQSVAEELEIVIVNDGSTDGVSAVFEKYLKSRALPDVAIKFFNQENAGAPAARNHGRREASGDYLLFSDADATYRSDALEKMKQALEANPQASYAYPSFMWGKKAFKVGAFDAEKLKQGPMIHTTALIRASAFTAKGWDESIKKLQDWDLWLTMLEEGKTGVWIDEVLFTISPGGHYSNWVPSIAYKVMPFLPAVKKYKNALAIVKAKHNLA